MRDWEFLLQKEGDRSWLPLESPTVEILEGRYRVVAQSRRENSPVEIRVVHQSSEENPPKRRLQMRSGQTNDRGLIVILPYTHLQPGQWELRAQGDLMADMLGESWQATVELQVVPQEAEWEWCDLSADSNVGAAEPAGAASLQAVAVAAGQAERSVAVPQPVAVSAVAEAALSAPALVAEAAQPESGDRTCGRIEPASIESASDLAGRSLRQDLDFVADAVLDEDVAAASEPAAANSSDYSSSDDEVSAAGEVQIVLEQTSFVARQGELLRLSGRLEAPSGSIDISGLRMEVILRDPQQSQILAEVREPLPPQALPLPFECAIEIPNREQTHLLLGEITVSTTAGAIVARLSFTVTIALEQLLAALTSAQPETEWLQPPLQFADPAPPDLNLALLNLVGTPQAQPPLQPFQPSTSPALPPQLVQPESDRAPKPLQLPFGDRSRPSAPVEVGLAERTSTPAEPIAPPEPPAESTPIVPVEESALEAIDLPADLPLELLMPSDPIRSPLAAPATPEDAAFRSLNLQQRFWSRLNSLATDAELTDWLADDAPLPGSSDSPVLPEDHARPLPGADAKFATQEFVVEDEYPTRSRPTQPLEPPDSMVLSAEESVPTPQLTVPAGELTAGTSISVRVKLPNLTPRIYVKLWLCDAQSRSVLEGPRWLADFIPDGRGSLEARISLTVPYGCVELQLEAIAIEMATQRESHKAIILRPVVPPDLSVSAIDLDF